MWPFASKNDTLEKLKDLKKSVLEIKDLSQSWQETFERQLKEINKSLQEMKDPADEALDKFGKIFQMEIPSKSLKECWILWLLLLPWKNLWVK